MQQLVWQPVRPDVLRDAVESITRLPGVIAAYLSDYDDAFWQSETGVDAYEQANRPHEHLPKVEGGQLPWETESVDISRHWGRRVGFADFWLVGGGDPVARAGGVQVARPRAAAGAAGG